VRLVSIRTFTIREVKFLQIQKWLLLHEPPRWGVGPFLDGAAQWVLPSKCIRKYLPTHLAGLETHLGWDMADIS